MPFHHPEGDTRLVRQLAVCPSLHLSAALCPKKPLNQKKSHGLSATEAFDWFAQLVQDGTVREEAINPLTTEETTGTQLPMYGTGTRWSVLGHRSRTGWSELPVC